MALTKVDPSVVDDQVFGRRNVIINGSMQVAQRTTSTTDIGASGGYRGCDRWQIVTNGISGRLTQSQETDSPDDFGFSTKLACTTADTSIGASDYFILQYDVEGQDLKRFGKGTSSAKEFTISFFVKGNASANYTLELYDTDNNRQISKTYSVTTSWSRVELTYPADTTGANTADSTSGLSLKFWLHAGTDRTSGTLNSSAWGAGSNTSSRVSSSSTNFFDSTSRTFFITGVQLEVGSQATPFEHLTFGEELALCERYYQRINNPMLRGVASTTSATTVAVNRLGLSLKSEMRAAPTIAIAGTFKVYDGLNIGTVSNVQATYSSTSSLEVDVLATFNSTAGNPVVSYLTGDNKITAEAEL